MTLSRILLASVAALAFVSAQAMANEPLPSPPSTAAPAAPPQVAPAPAAPLQVAPAPAAPAQIAPAQVAPAQATPPRTGHGGELDDVLDAEAMKKLTGDQIVEVMRQRAIATHSRPEDVAPVMVPVALFLFLFLGVTGGLYFGARKDRERHETLRAMIQRGGRIPPELLVPPVKKYSDLRRGIILVAGGLGLAIFVGATPIDKGVWTVGLIPMLIGAGYLVSWKLMRPEPQPIRDEAAIAAEREVNDL